MIIDHFCEGFLRQNVSARSEPLIPANWTSRTRSRLHNTHLQSLLKYYSLFHFMNKLRRTGDTGTCCRAETRQKERRTKEIITVVTIITIKQGTDTAESRNFLLDVSSEEFCTRLIMELVRACQSSREPFIVDITMYCIQNVLKIYKAGF